MSEAETYPCKEASNIAGENILTLSSLIFSLFLAYFLASHSGKVS